LPNGTVEPYSRRHERCAHPDGYLHMRGAVPAAWIAPLQAAFEAGVRPSDQWPVSRGPDWRHAQLDLDPVVQQVCHLPQVLAAARQVIGGPFFFGQVEGRAPISGGGAQPLHRDNEDGGVVSALVYLDPYGPANGATRVAAGTHRDGVTAEEVVLAGDAGDILLFDARLMHGATRNVSGALRRTLLILYAAEPLYPTYKATEALRAVRMDTTPVFG
jgi:hypothetical protein